ncbi:hypothetical protein Hypma_010341 [Hypsizygus marmoreus]|uniref:Ribosomal RNA-processing protein 8 n=1 Tax=Hypsizygus marmoreus TaxID=39966 RepID=A0A369JR70_HYPMA|nr:hypothetical protein Hypma_010341 [Hypsizygus marmoreus]
MALFDVPGWTMPAKPVAESSNQVSKKRKRPASLDADKLQAAEVNLDKLVKRLKGNSSEASKSAQTPNRGEISASSKGDRQGKKTKKAKPKASSGAEKKEISWPKPLQPTDKDLALLARPTKKAKTKHMVETSTPPPPAAVSKKAKGLAASLTALQQGMKQSLDGARFRMINESLYKTDSRKAHQMMKEDPQVFEDYHTGFRHQVQVWPTNPVEHYITTFSAYPSKTVIADLGCGDAAIARALVPKGFAVLSFDLVSDGAFVVEADTCSKIPLPGCEETEDEKSGGYGHVVDVVVCALSLMGTNWPNCIREAWRILKTGGELQIAEVASRFTDIEEFQTLVGTIGFKLQSKDDSNSHFTLFEFKKVPRKHKSEKEWAKVVSRASILKPCEYKRR